MIKGMKKRQQNVDYKKFLQLQLFDKVMIERDEIIIGDIMCKIYLWINVMVNW